MKNLTLLVAATTAVGLSGGVHAQSDDPMWQTARQVSTHIGEMAVSVAAGDVEIDDRLRFEPYQQLEEMFARDDVVFVMRHGPTDWSDLDEKNVAPTDCANQRVMIDEGIRRMRDFGTLLASNEIIPSEIVVSEWCRNQQTLDAILEGFERVDPAIAANMPIETDPALNLLLSLQGSKDVDGLRDRVSSWDGHPDRPGPLLIFTHYTNIEELTQFRVFEGEALVLDPKRDNLVLGYVRLRSASPDVGHFSDALDSPLLEESQAMDLVTRYYDALKTGEAEQLRDILSDRWTSRGVSSTAADQGVEGFMAEMLQIADGLEDGRFLVDDVYVADDVVTVIGTVRGRHTGDIYGIGATGREVSFGGIAVHRISNGEIVESWQMADRVSLIQQISD